MSQGLRCAWLGFCCARMLLAQTAPADEPVVFKSKVSLVPVPVVVRDVKGHAVGGLTVENFQLTDRGQPQKIVTFSMERAAAVMPDESPVVSPATGAAKKPAAATILPERFTAYFFDDLHMAPADMIRSRE